MKNTNRIPGPVIHGLIIIGFILPYVFLGACASDSQATGTPATTAPSEPPSAEDLASQGFQKPEIGRITADGLKQMIDDGGPVVIVDTRESFFYNMGHIAGAINIEYQSENHTSLLALPKDQLLVFYCD